MFFDIKLIGIYKIEHKSGYYYIGMSKDMFNRWQNHFSQLKKHTHSSTKFQDLFDISIIEDWTFSVLYRLSRTEVRKKSGLKGNELEKLINKLLLQLEKEYMSKYNVGNSLNKSNKNFKK